MAADWQPRLPVLEMLPTAICFAFHPFCFYVWTFHLMIIRFLRIFGNLSIFPHLGADTWFPLRVSMLPKQVQQILYTSRVCFFKLKKNNIFFCFSIPIWEFHQSRLFFSCLGKHLSDFSLFVSHHPRIFSSFFFEVCHDRFVACR